jgi:uncharacterized membrane protein
MNHVFQNPSQKEKKDPEYHLGFSYVTRAQLFEGIVMTLVFPILALIFRRFPYFKTNYIGHIAMYGVPAGLTWVARKYAINWYQKTQNK